jgi:hypothetical protein
MWTSWTSIGNISLKNSQNIFFFVLSSSCEKWKTEKIPYIKETNFVCTIYGNLL